MVWYYACSCIACGLFPLWLVIKLIWKKITCKYGFIYCPSNVPIFGSTPYLESDSHKLYKQHEELRQAYHIYLLWISWNPTIFADKTVCKGCFRKSNEPAKIPMRTTFCMNGLTLGW